MSHLVTWYVGGCTVPRCQCEVRGQLVLVCWAALPVLCFPFAGTSHLLPAAPFTVGNHVVLIGSFLRNHENGTKWQCQYISNYTFFSSKELESPGSGRVIFKNKSKLLSSAQNPVVGKINYGVAETEIKVFSEEGSQGIFYHFSLKFFSWAHSFLSCPPSKTLLLTISHT